MSSRLTALDMLTILPGTLRNWSIFIHILLPISSSTFMQVSPQEVSGLPEQSLDDGASRAIKVYRSGFSTVEEQPQTALQSHLSAAQHSDAPTKSDERNDYCGPTWVGQSTACVPSHLSRSLRVTPDGGGSVDRRAPCVVVILTKLTLLLVH
jgi:hypothetical protein